MCGVRGFRSDDDMITAEGLTKRFGEKTAVDRLDFTVHPGRVTGFLGPNGAGKSTTMRMVVGLDRPSAGSVTVNGRRYAEHRAPLHEVGALLDAKAVHTGRTAENHLLAMAATHGIGRQRVREVIELTGLESVARKRVGGFSLGMGQRLGIAAALLGDPATLILDEPVNGLDPEGVLWVRRLVRNLAAEGRTIFLSSHLMSEMALTADHLIVLGKGRIITDAPVADVIAGGTRSRVNVRSPHASRLADLLAGPDVTVMRADSGVLEVTGLEASAIGDLAARHSVAIHELTPKNASLEEAYMALTADAVEYRTEALR
jgi:ABC-2 type transport system ATP-binding protein